MATNESISMELAYMDVTKLWDLASAEIETYITKSTQAQVDRGISLQVIDLIAHIRYNALEQAMCD